MEKYLESYPIPNLTYTNLLISKNFKILQKSKFASSLNQY